MRCRTCGARTQPMQLFCCEECFDEYYVGEEEPVGRSKEVAQWKQAS